MTDESLLWDGKVLDIDNIGNSPTLLALSTLEAFNVDDDFWSKLKGAYCTCAYFHNDNNERRLRQKIEKSSDEFLAYHTRVVIPLPSNVLIKALLFKYHDNTGHPNYRRLMASLLKRYWWEKNDIGLEIVLSTLYDMQ